MNERCFILDDNYIHPRSKPGRMPANSGRQQQNVERKLIRPHWRTRTSYRPCWRTEETTEFDCDSLVPCKRHVVHPSDGKEVCEAESATSTTTRKLNHSAPNRHVSTLVTNFFLLPQIEFFVGSHNSEEEIGRTWSTVDRFEACSVTEHFFWSRRGGDRGNKSTW